MNDVHISLAPDGIRVKINIYTFTKGFTKFITNKGATEQDIRGDKK